jgi:hypothetical protein
VQAGTSTMHWLAASASASASAVGRRQQQQQQQPSMCGANSCLQSAQTAALPARPPSRRTTTGNTQPDQPAPCRARRLPQCRLAVGASYQLDPYQLEATNPPATIWRTLGECNKVPSPCPRCCLVQRHARRCTAFPGGSTPRAAAHAPPALGSGPPRLDGVATATAYSADRPSSCLQVERQGLLRELHSTASQRGTHREGTPADRGVSKRWRGHGPLRAPASGVVRRGGGFIRSRACGCGRRQAAGPACGHQHASALIPACILKPATSDPRCGPCWSNGNRDGDLGAKHTSPAARHMLCWARSCPLLDPLPGELRLQSGGGCPATYNHGGPDTRHGVPGLAVTGPQQHRWTVAVLDPCIQVFRGSAGGEHASSSSRVS